MMPVEEGKTSAADTPNSFPASRQTCSQARMPTRPVAQLALPEFTTTARTRPPVKSSDLAADFHGAATTRFFVNNAAALAPPAASTSARSGRPLTFMPAATAEKENPTGKRIFSGELLSSIRSAVMPESSTSFSAAARWQTSADRRGSSLLRRSDRAGGTDNSLCGSCREDPGDAATVNPMREKKFWNAREQAHAVNVVFFRLRQKRLDQASCRRRRFGLRDRR